MMPIVSPEGLAPVMIEGKEGYIDKTGKVVIDPKFFWAYPFSEGLAPVLLGDFETGKWYYIDKTGAMIIGPLDAEIAEGFKGGLAGIMTDFKWGYIDTTGKFIWPQIVINLPPNLLPKIPSNSRYSLL